MTALPRFGCLSPERDRMPLHDAVEANNNIGLTTENQDTRA